MIKRLHFIFLLCLIAFLLPAQQPETVITAPPSVPVRTMAEWEELQALVITWRSSSTTNFTGILTEIVRAAREECRVIICCNDQNTVTSAQNTLIGAGVNISSNVSFLVAPNNSIWVRDYGPNCVYANKVDSLYFVDWKYNRISRPLDDALPAAVAEYMGVPLYATTLAPADLVNTGGNFMSDGMGTAFASRLIMSENQVGNPYGVTTKTESQINQIFSDYMGIDRYIKMQELPYDGIHHIDMHMKLLDEETLLVGQYPDGVADGPQIEANIQYVLSNYQSAFGTPYKVIRIPMPPQFGDYPDNGGDYRTYANAVFVNKTVLLPVYEEQYDTTALRIWRESLPGYNVVGIDCNSIIGLSGAIHCITKEIGVNDPLRIVHKPVEKVFVGEFNPWQCPIIAEAQHRSGVASVSLHYRRETETEWHVVSLTQVNNPDSLDFWAGEIPDQPGYVGNMQYYLDAVANNGKTIARPMPGPEGPWEFPLIYAPASTTEAPRATLQDIFPNPAHAITAIPVSASQRSSGSIAVYNALGQLVTNLYQGDFPVGTSHYFLDAGKYVPGTYFVQLQTNGNSVLKKLLIR